MIPIALFEYEILRKLFFPFLPKADIRILSSIKTKLACPVLKENNADFFFYYLLLGISENCKDNIIAVTRDWTNFNESEDEKEIFHNQNKSGLESLRKLVESSVPEENRFSYRYNLKKKLKWFCSYFFFLL